MPHSNFFKPEYHQTMSDCQHDCNVNGNFHYLRQAEFNPKIMFILKLISSFLFLDAFKKQRKLQKVKFFLLCCSSSTPCFGLDHHDFLMVLIFPIESYWHHRIELNNDNNIIIILFKLNKEPNLTESK